MKRGLTFLSIILFATAVNAGSQKKAADPMSDAHITKEEREKAINLLFESQKEFLDSVQNLSQQQWDYRPSPFKWSVGLVAEHIALTQDRLFSVIERSLNGQPDPDWKAKTAGKEALLERILPTRTGRAQAPVEVRPTGKLSREEILNQFKKSRERIIDFAQKTDLPLKAYTFDNPFPIFSTLNAYDWLLYVPFHTTRHVKQIEEVKASPGFPK
jgi:hypothetical protein